MIPASQITDARLDTAPLTLAPGLFRGRTVLVSAFTHYRRDGVPDMSGHATALLGAAAFGELHLRDQLKALEQATPGSWNWKAIEKLDDTSDAPSTVANSVTGIAARRW